MEDSAVLIRQQMEQTRASLQEKLETLEHQVVDTVQGAAHTVTDTVKTVKDAVEETVGTVKGTVREAVSSVKESLDVRRHVEEHPWPMMLGSIAVGYAGELLLEQLEPHGSRVTSNFYTAPSATPAPTYHEGNGRSSGESFTTGSHVHDWLHDLASQYQTELTSLKSLAIGTLMGVLRDVVRSNAPPQLGSQLADVVDSFTVKFGGKPIQGSILE